MDPINIKDAQIVRVERLSEKISRFTLHAPDIAGGAQPGQFVMVKAVAGQDPLLRRPFSIHQVLPNCWSR